MRIVSAQVNSGLMSVTAVRKEEDRYVYFTVEETLDRDRMTIQPVFTNRTENKPVSDWDKAVLYKILKVVTDDYEFRPDTKEESKDENKEEAEK